MLHAYKYSKLVVIIILDYLQIYTHILLDYYILQKLSHQIQYDEEKCQAIKHHNVYCSVLPSPNGCRNQVRPALPGVLASGRVGPKARMVFTSALLSPAVGISNTGMTVHWSSKPSDVITSV